ncbi:sigma-70 family RNA polymerase sigma factor [Candidatus Peregrinibacteria bacterium]|nr:sigma-70 family RNA polymerase sigma factor [bacterium]NCQ55326.1 sigma-70 family RNA polymerase sigma factor [Candidatus Parcubacteria bacterium]NCS67161.1 sigma-70 family RNA polymerase sigma factor [Candidatus Peregrinibacteria bacterium]
MHSEKNLSDEAIVKAAQKDLAHFAILVERYEQKLKYYILRISNFSELEAEEILQDVFVKAWKNLNGFDETLKFSSWIYRITHNETISAFRKSKSRGEENRSIIEPELFENLPDENNFIEEIDQKMTAVEVQTILKTLPENYREVLILRFIEDKSYEEMSDILMKPGGTIATLLNRAKTQFKESYQRQFTS